MRKTAPLSLSFGLLLATGLVAHAADLVQRDPACSHIATVQYLDCEVAVLYSCPGPRSLATPLIREEAYNADGLDTFEVDTAHGGMVVTGDAAGSYTIRSDIATLKETTMADVVATGRGKFSADATLTMFGVKKPAGQKISITATGKTPVISGLPTVEFIADVAVDLPEPMGATVSTSKAYLVQSLGVYLAGETSVGTYYKPEDTPHRPMSVALPGQAGFDTIKPSFCGGSLSQLFPLNLLNGVPA